MGRDRAVKPRRIYLASSNKNHRYHFLLDKLRSIGHEVYDFKNPRPDKGNFTWERLGLNAKLESPWGIRDGLKMGWAVNQFIYDQEALDWCDTLIMLLPCGKSAHLELGYAVGQGKDTVIALFADDTPELMYKLAKVICLTEADLLDYLDVPLG